MKNTLVSRPIPPPISCAYSTSLMVTKAPPRAMARASQRRAKRCSPARADAAPFAAAQPLATRTIVLYPASVRSSAVCPDANTAGLTARVTMNAPRKRPKATSSLRTSTHIIGSPGSPSKTPHPDSSCSQSVTDIRSPDRWLSSSTDKRLCRRANTRDDRSPFAPLLAGAQRQPTAATARDDEPGISEDGKS